MKRPFLFSLVTITALLAVTPVQAVLKPVQITHVHVEPNVPANRDSISIVVSGTGGSSPAWIDDSNFHREGTYLELDVFLTLGPYGKPTVWSHSETIGTLPVGSYDLTVQAYSYNIISDTYELSDTYLTSFIVVPGPPIQADIQIQPRTVNLRSKAKWLTCHIWLPDDYNVSDIEPNSVRLLAEPNDIYPDWLWFEGQEQLAMAKFDRSKLNDILIPGDVELTVTGQLTDGTIFEGTDVIRVIDKRRQRK